MGELIAFKPPAKQPATSNRQLSKDGKTAEILFFTGVRYVPAREHEMLLKQIGRRSRRSANRLKQEQLPR